MLGGSGGGGGGGSGGGGHWQRGGGAKEFQDSWEQRERDVSGTWEGIDAYSAPRKEPVFGRCIHKVLKQATPIQVSQRRRCSSWKTLCTP